jgi:hypothetical protein
MVTWAGLNFALLCAGVGLAPAAAEEHRGSAVYLDDCNEYGGPGHLHCTDPLRSFTDNGQYVGHDEPSVQFFSNTPGSGFNAQWDFILPRERPATSNSGSVGGGPVQTFQNYPAFWVSMDLCDPLSFPFGDCVGSSDSQPSTNPGAALLELQFYPPGMPTNLFGSGSSTHWRVAMTIDSLTQNNSCFEPVNVAFITTNGNPGGTKFEMNQGDRIHVQLVDTTDGLLAIVRDLSKSPPTQGFMIASAANGFKNTRPSDCAKFPFSFHPTWSTATTDHIAPWTALQVNVGFALEIGHLSTWPCDGSPQDNPGQLNATSNTSPSFKVCEDNAGDLDFDGFSYIQNDWPPSTNAAQTAVQIISPLGHGLGPTTSFQTYPTMRFATTQPTNQGAFYPYYVLASPDPYNSSFNCALLPGGFTLSNTDVVNTFGGAAQFNFQSFANPCPR